MKALEQCVPNSLRFVLFRFPQIKEFSLGRLADFSLTRLEDGYVHWAYAPAGKDASLHAKGKVRQVQPQPLCRGIKKKTCICPTR